MKQKTGRKLLSFLLTLAMVIGLFPGMSLTAYAASTTVTWNASDITDANSDSFTKNGITFAPGYAEFDRCYFTEGGTFTTTSGKFTKIEVTDTYVGISGTGWSGDDSKMTWTGAASSSVSYSGEIMDGDEGALKIVFTIETADATHSVTITPGSNMTKTDASGAASQTGLSGAMENVVYIANDGYKFPETDDAYTTTNGITVAVSQDLKTITVSGTPTANTEITIPDAAKKPTYRIDVFDSNQYDMQTLVSETTLPYNTSGTEILGLWYSGSAKSVTSEGSDNVTVDGISIAVSGVGTAQLKITGEEEGAFPDYELIVRENITSVEVGGIETPVAAAALDTTATVSTANVTLNDSGKITWTPAAPQDGKAAFETAYTATVTAKANDNYVFSDGVTATVNGNTALSVTKNEEYMPSAGTLATISYTFAATEATPHTHGDGVTFTAWDGTTSLPTEAGNYYLTQDVTISSTWSVPEGMTNLCLNGRGIRYSGSGAQVITVSSGTTLNLYDCDTATVHKYTVDGDGLATVNDSATGEGVQTFTGGYITGGSSQNGGVYVQGTLNMHGGTIVGNTAKNGEGGGVSVADGGTFTMSGGTITGNTAAYGGSGVYNYGTFTMSGGSITSNTTTGDGGVENFGTFTMSGGSITNNTATGYGGGVYNYMGTFTMSGGSITDNTTTGDGGGVYNTKDAAFELSGNPTITGNKKGDDASNVYVPNGRTITLTGALADTARVGVTMATPGVFTNSTGDAKAKDYAANFTSDDSAYPVAAESNELKLAQAPVPYMAWDETSKTVKNVEGGCTDYTVVDSSTTTWGIADTTTWYVANSGETEFNNNAISVTGHVNLILCDGAMVGVYNHNLTVASGSSLTVYGQAQGTGQLSFITSSYSTVPQFTLNGGQVTFTGGIQGSATVYGGKLDVTINERQSAITGDVVIYGGMLNCSSFGGSVIGGNVELNGGSLDIQNIEESSVIGGTLKTALSGRAWSGNTESAVAADTYSNQTLNYSRIQIPVLYNLWVGGVRVTKLNAADVFGDGSVSYDDQTHTLALNNYSYSGVGYKGNANMPNNSDTCGAAVFYDEESPLTIALTGENRLVSTADGVLGIGVYSGTSLTIKGSGSLTAAAPGGSYYSSAGICINSDSYNATLTLQDGCTVTAAGGDRNPNAYSNCYGIAGSGYDFEVRIENATVNVFGGHEEGYGVYGSVALTNGSLTAEGTYRAIYNTLTTAPGFGIQVSNESFDAAVPSDDFNYKKFVKVEPLPDGTVTLAKEKLKVLDGQDSKSAELAIDVRPTDGVPGAVSWSATSADGGVVALYSDADCTAQLSANDTAGSGKLYIRGVKPGTVTLAFTNTVNDKMHASCVVTVLDSTRILTVYEGEDTNESVPIYRYQNSQSQFVIPASQLTQMKDAIITGMTFYADTDSVNWNDSQYEVYMAEVEETTLTAMLDWANMTRVREAACVSLAEGEMSIELSAPYAYNGGNLLIGFKQTTSGYCFSSYSWIGTQVNGASYGGYTDYWGDHLNQQDFIPMVTFTMHRHSLTYSSDGTAIFAHCANEDGKCLLPDQTATLTIVAPAKTTYGDANSAEATITDANNIKGEAAIQYQTKTGGAYGAATTTAPTNAGDHKASITVGGATASVEYTIAKADPSYTVPTGLTATYGQTLAAVTLPDGWAWANSSTSVGNAGSNTFKANFTPTDTANYNTVSNVDVTVTVEKAANPAAVAGTASVTKGGNTVDLSTNVTMNGATGTVSYVISGEANGCTLNGSVLTSGTNAGTVTVNVSIAADDNYNALDATPITVTVLNYTALTVDNAPTISGGHNPPQVGDTLTANTTATDLTYQWYRGDVAIEGATSASYTAVAADVGKTIKVTVTQTKKADGTDYADNEKPTQTSAAIGPIKKNLADENVTVTFTGGGSRPTVTVRYGTPAQPVSANDYTVEYSDPTGTPSIVTVTVTPKDGTNYTGTITKKYTLAPEAKFVFNADFMNFTSETFADTFTQGGVTYEISLSSDFTTTVSGGANLLESNESSKTYYIRVAEKTDGDAYPASGATQFTITRPNAPGKALFTVAGATSGSAKDGRITVSDLEIAKQLEYSTDGTSYKEVPETGIITDLDDGNVLIRYEAKTASGVLKSKAQTVNVPIKTVDLTSVTISGTAKYGETLRAALNAGVEAPTGTITYQWLRDGVVISGATDSTYTLGAEDIGHTITLSVAQNGGAAQTAVTPLVTKASGSTAKPTVTASGISKTDTTITVNSPVNGDGKTYEYSIDGGKTWQESKSFTGLTPLASYSVVVREKGNGTTEPGASSVALTVKTDAEVLTLDSVSIKYPNNTDTVQCGQTLQAIVTQTGSTETTYTSDSGVSYQWLRNGVVISDETGSTYTLTAEDVGKKITVKVSKVGSDDVTSSEQQAKTVTKATALSKPTVTAGNITKTNTTITVNGFKNNPAKSLEYQYAVIASDAELTESDWKDSNSFTELTASKAYNVYVRVKGTDARFASAASTAVPVTTDAHPLPFNEGTQTPAVVIPSYSYGATPSTPSLNVEPSTGATVTYYWSKTAFKSSDVATAGTKWAAPNLPAEVGTYYVRAVVSGNNYTTFVSGQTALKVTKAPKAADTAALTPTNIDTSTLTVTLGSGASDKTLEYAVIQGSGNLADAAWSSIPANATSFTIDRKLTPTSATLYVREKADANYEASTPVSATFTPAVYTVSYDLNGGTGSVPPTVMQTSGQTVTVDTDAKPTRAGYEFLGWNTSASATEKMSAATVSGANTLYAIWEPHTYTVKFNVNGGSDVSDKTGVKYGEEFILPTTTKAGSVLAGWSKSTAATTADYTAGQLVKNLAGKDKTADEITLYAVWTEVASVSGTVSSNEGENVTLKLMRGDTQIGDTQTVTLDPTGNGYEGAFQFDGVPYGIYNLVIEQVVPTGNGDETETLTKSILVTVSGGSVTIDNDKLKMPTSTRSALQVVGTDTPPAVVDGLDKLAENEAVDERSVTVTMTVEKQEEQTVSQTATEEEKATQEAIDKLKSSADTASGSNGEVKEMDFLNINITKEVTLNGAVESTEAITDTASIMEVIFPYAKPGSGKIDLWRFHGAAQKFNEKSSRPGTPADLDFYFLDGMIHLFTRYFSTYAVSYTETTSSGGNNGGNNSGNNGGSSGSYSGGGGSSSSGTTYAPTVSNSSNGTVSVSPTSPKSGDKVTITAKPDAGYEVDTVTVTNASGKTVSVTKVNDTTYTFTQPSSKVKIDVTFKETSTTDALAKFSDVNASDWYADAVRWAVDNGVMNGIGGGKFNPNGETSRGMVVTMLWRLEGSPAYVGASEFSDVDSEQWYGQAVRWANAEGIVEGYTQNGSKVFNPNGAVTREQLAAILYRYAQFKKADVSVGEDTNILSYDDAFSVSGWATSAMQWAVGSGIINGVGSDLVPADNATRAQVATMLMRYSTAK